MFEKQKQLVLYHILGHQFTQELKEFLGGHIVLAEGGQFCWYLQLDSASII